MKLVDGLDAPTFADREAARKELERLGPLVVPALTVVARETTSAEVRKRIGDLLGKLDQPTLTGEPLRQARAVEMLEWIGDGRRPEGADRPGRGCARRRPDPRRGCGPATARRPEVNTDPK